MLRKYQHFDRTRLFMDSPDWRITQKWISVEVPWKAEFEQKFRIVLKKESPVVLVLSQLDDRYFDGLQGQYSFRLQFRLHEVDSPGEQDYIVRSHGNYLMERSVVTELKSLPAGTYSVFIMVVADRDLTQSTIEEVIKEQCKQKVDNDKLAQVGTSYDIAHSKGAVHMESRVAARKAHDKLKARESRIATRKKNWEKRHLSRHIVRKQEKKNREKRERKEAEDVADEHEEEEKPKDKAIQTEDAKEVRFEKEDKAIQTEDPNAVSEQISTSELPASKENDKGVQTDNVAHTYADSQGTPETPKSSSIANSPRQSVRIHTYASGPPPPPQTAYTHHSRKASMSQRNYPRAPQPHQYVITSDGESSASPISEFDDMYSDDDPTLKPRPINTGGAPSGTSKPRTSNSDDEDETEPWNAVCIVGFRVYSKDEGLEVKIFEEGNHEEAVDVIDEGSEADVEDDAEKKQNMVGEGASETKDMKGEEPSLPIRSNEEEELVLVDGEKKALCLAGEDTPSNSKDAVESTISTQKAMLPKDIEKDTPPSTT